MINLNKSENSIKSENIQLSPIKNQNFEKIQKGELDNSIISSPRDLNFYALGKIKKLDENLDKKINNSFRGGANNLLMRNYLSINNKQFDKLKIETPKQFKTIFHHNFDENNYLEPFKPFNYGHKYDIPSYSINHEMYNLNKNKLYAKDYNNSNIIQGRQISINEFISHKKDSKDINHKNYTSRNNIKSMRTKIIEKIRKYENPINIKEKLSEEKEKTCDEMIKEKYENKKLNHSLSTRLLYLKNPLNFPCEKLKSINIHLDKNYKKILRGRNWWKVE